MVDDVLLHEMLHVWLLGAGQEHKHASDAWYGAVRRLSPAVLGHELDVSRPRRRSVRVPNPGYGPDDRRRTLVRKRPADDDGLHASVARWPVAFRPPGYDFGARIGVST